MELKSERRNRYPVRDKEIFGYVKQMTGPGGARAKEAFASDIAVWDYVVHIDTGSRFSGCTTIEAGRGERISDN